MRALSEQRRLFVYAYMARPNATQAAIAAGYVDNGNGSIRVQAHRLIHDPRILAAIREQGEEMMAAVLPTALRTIIDHASNPQSKDSLKAALAVAGMAGISPIVKQETHVEHTIDLEGAMETVRRLAAKYEGELPPALRAKVAEMKMIDVTPAAGPSILSDDELTAPG